jgi:AcrR family transcriptional regulator
MSIVTDMNSPRRYTMTTRAASAEQTRLRILDSAVALAGTRVLAQISLDDIASAAGVSVQTVLRRFGSRAGVLEAAREHAVTQVVSERRTPVGDVDAAVRVVVDHYEQRGDGVVLMLAQERSDPAVRSITDSGRQLHRDWVEETFAPYLPTDAEARIELLDLVGVATDVYTWQQLRRDRGASRARTEARMARLVRALLPDAP